MTTPWGPQKCIQDGDPCHWNGSLGYCCSGNCEQWAGQPLGKCSISSTVSVSSSSSASATSYSSAGTTSSSCLREGEICKSDGSLGTCCSFVCDQLKENPTGVCVGSNPPTSLPPKCLEVGANCTRLGELGFCCNGNCKVIAPHTVGICEQIEQTTIRNEGGRGVRENDNGPPWIIVTPVTLIVVGLILIALLWLYRRQKRLEKVLSPKETQHFFYGDPESIQSNVYAHEIADNYPYDKVKWEIKEPNFVVDYNSPLGSGCFGVVLKGKVNGKDVAVKTVRNSMGSGSHLKSLLSEIKVLQYIGKYENIVSMVGSNTSDINSGKVFLFLEYCSSGSLDKYLQKNKSRFREDQLATNKVNMNSYLNSTNLESPGHFTKVDMLNWCLQITNAMKFLETKKVIHADLAARNVLLLTKDCAKLTDFGLSRRLYEYASYVKTQQEPLPWRHMALESLQHLSFSHQSDIWSLGIFFWEVFSFASVPYPGITWTPQFTTFLMNNLRPPKPENCSDELYDLMLDCWHPEPNSRPTFEDIYKRLQTFIEALKPNGYGDKITE